MSQPFLSSGVLIFPSTPSFLSLLYHNLQTSKHIPKKIRKMVIPDKFIAFDCIRSLYLL